MKFTLGLAASLLLAGCTLLTGVPGEIAGSVTDIAGNPVRAARIFLDGQQVAESSPIGTFTIREASVGRHTLRAEISQEGVNYRGRNEVQVFDNDRSTSVGLVIAPIAQLGTMRGNVRDKFGAPVPDIPVFAAGPLNSWIAYTNSNGDYTMEDLVGGYSYTVSASGRGYESDTTTFSAIAGQTLTLNFTLVFSNNQNQTVVSNLSAKAWTSPEDPTRRPEGAYNAIKRLHDRRRPAEVVYTSRERHGGARIPGGPQIEIDLAWDYVFNSELWGYGIFRGTNPTGTLDEYDVLRDPLASFYADIADDLFPGTRYYYQVNRLNSDFPNLNGGGPLSSDTSAVPLDELEVRDPILLPSISLRWFSVVDVTTYTAYVFDTFPGVNVSAVWSGTTSGTSLNYTGPAVSGSTYYYVVIGDGFTAISSTISQIDSFVAP